MTDGDRALHFLSSKLIPVLRPLIAEKHYTQKDHHHHQDLEEEKIQRLIEYKRVRHSYSGSELLRPSAIFEDKDEKEKILRPPVHEKML